MLAFERSVVEPCIDRRCHNNIHVTIPIHTTVSSGVGCPNKLNQSCVQKSIAQRTPELM